MRKYTDYTFELNALRGLLIIKIFALLLVPKFLWHVSNLNTPETYISIMFLLIARGLSPAWVVICGIVTVVLPSETHIVLASEFLTVFLSLYLVKNIDIKERYAKIFIRFIGVSVVVYILQALCALHFSFVAAMNQFLANIIFYNIVYATINGNLIRIKDLECR